MFVSYLQVTKISTINVANPYTLIGLLIGASLPFLFSSIAINSVGKAAAKMVIEVRRQFKSIAGLREGTAKPDYKACVEISTSAALKGMIIPTIIAIASPIIIGLWNLEALGGLLAGTLASGFLLAIYMANSGGAWDNAKKFIEDGAHGGKGSVSHMAAITGDTLGDPFKDTAGPSLHVLIKLLGTITLVLVPLFI